jgi:hypothetical protein
MDEYLEQSFRPLPFNRMQCVHRERETPCQESLDQEEHRRDDDRDDADGRCETEVRPRLAQELVVDFDGKHPIAFADEERRTEIRESSHEYQKGSRQYRRHAQGDGDFEEPPYSRTAETIRCFKERIVDILQSTRYVKENQREQLQRQNQEDAVESVNVGNGDARHRLDEHRDDARPSQQLNPRVRTDERCRHRTENDQYLNEPFPPYVVHVVEVGQGDADDQCQQCGPDRDIETVNQGFRIVLDAEELHEPLGAQFPIFPYHGIPQYREHGIQ